MLSRLLIALGVLLLPVLFPGAARAQPKPQWIGAWANAEEHTTLTITGGTLTLLWADAKTPERYNWTGRLYDDKGDPATWGYLPGFYFAYDLTPVTASAIRAALDAAWAPRLAFSAGDPAIASRYATLKARVDHIHAGSYQRLRRFCINDRRATTDCLAPTRNEYFISDGDHLVLVLIDPAVPETSNILVFSRAGASAVVAQVRK
jgi:hypothetical protein